jgi:hypothetical protein
VKPGNGSLALGRSSKIVQTLGGSQTRVADSSGQNGRDGGDSSCNEGDEADTMARTFRGHGSKCY